VRRATLLILLLTVLAPACGDDTPPGSIVDDSTTVPGTSEPRTRTEPGVAWVDSVDLLLLESYPVQLVAVVKGTLPTPCHDLAWLVAGPDADGRVTPEISSRLDRKDTCAQTRVRFEVSSPVGSLTRGEYPPAVDGSWCPFTIRRSPRRRQVAVYTRAAWTLVAE